LRYEGYERELSAGFRLTTNNRMELLGAIAGLEALKEPCHVQLLSDSEYLVNAMRNRWAERWEANGWRRNRSELASNPDLWARLLNLARLHDVSFEWVRGHVGHPDNERCDRLANEAARSHPTGVDEGYESSR
jgi:ribonuclease HI